MISLKEVSVQRGPKILLANADLTIYPGHKLGIIGPNGCGKTSLFQVLLGNLGSDTGHCHVPKHWQVAHMAQEISSDKNTALDYVLAGDAELVEVQNTIADDQHDGEKLAALYEQLEAIDGYTAASRAQQLLNGLGFLPGDDKKGVNEFSGGWRIRLNLARALMCRSDLLLLDEPTNHLDLDACLWLERWLQSYPGTLVIISHDRDFLDNVVNGIVSFENEKLQFYSGNYSDYERQKAARLAEQESAFNKQQERISEIENFVRRFRAQATKAKQAQSRLKELERMEKIAPAHVDSPFTFRFFKPEKCPQQMLTLTQVDIGYGNKAIIKNANVSVHGNTRIALLGANGAGKTTFIKLLANKVEALAGERIEGANLNIGYFAQHQLESLDLQASCFLHIQRLTPTATEQSVRNFLGGFDFHGDRVFEPITHFSGGEKARLALAILAWQKPNLLLLDEPTNHLDIEVRHALTVALQAFEGAIIMISHDRHLIKNTVDEFWLVDHGLVQPFNGDLNDYYEYTQQAQITAKPSGHQTPSAGKQTSTKAAVPREKLKQLNNRVKSLETEIDKLTGMLRKTEATLMDPSTYTSDNVDHKKLLVEQTDLKTKLETAEAQWLETTEEVEQLKQ